MRNRASPTMITVSDKISPGKFSLFLMDVRPTLKKLNKSVSACSHQVFTSCKSLRGGSKIALRTTPQSGIRISFWIPFKMSFGSKMKWTAEAFCLAAPATPQVPSLFSSNNRTIEYYFSLPGPNSTSGGFSASGLCGLHFSHQTAYPISLKVFIRPVGPIKQMIQERTDMSLIFTVVLTHV